MTGGSHIRAVGPEAAQDAPSQPTDSPEDDSLTLGEEWAEDWEGEDLQPRARWQWLLPSMALLAAAGWTAFYVWAFRGEILAGGTLQQWTGWIVNWTVPLLLIASLWLLAMRNSRREASRFADTAALLSREAAELETRLGVVNRELSLAREFLGSQSRELESLGRVASERLSNHAEELSGLIFSNGSQIDSIASVSDTALINMQKLRDDLPVIANSARDVSNQVGNAGRTAHDQLGKLIAGFQRLNEFGQASEKQVQSLSGRIKASLDTFENQLDGLDGLASQRFETLKEKSEEFRADLNSREVDALAAMRHRADELRAGIAAMRSELAQEEERNFEALQARIANLSADSDALSAKLREADQAAFAAMGAAKDRLHREIGEVVANLDELDAKAFETAQQRIAALKEEAGRFDGLLEARDVKFNEEIARRQDAFDTRESQATEVLAQRLAELDENLAERREAQLAETESLVAHGEALAGKVQELSSLFENISAQAESAEQRIANGLSGLSGKANESYSTLEATGATIASLTEASIRLLEIIQSGARQSREDLPQAIETASAALSGVENRAMMLRSSMEETGQHGSALSDYVLETQGRIDAAGNSIEQLSARLDQHTEGSLARIETIRESLNRLGQESERLAIHSREELQKAIEDLVSAARHAFDMIDSGAEEAVGKAAERIGGLAGEAIERSIRSEGDEAIGRLEQAAANASGVGRDAAIQLRDQLAKVNELAGNLELRVNRARELAEEQVDNDFSRRMGLITDSLNSNAIDIAKAFSQEITDTAWASYLKGDRGIFTRRAVRLIDNAEAREIAELYETDDIFREHVSRYIHDFEGMLRSLLSTRDGNALSVTVLGSDMGKLYVALAQAIERFRN
ncbi:ATPase [Altererythrobacter sp.]|uniref:ATPase n=1 Tax=Altererythrobacter sp. TaxID=1872480 RepID=UPI003CFDC7CE